MSTLAGAFGKKAVPLISHAEVAEQQAETAKTVKARQSDHAAGAASANRKRPRNESGDGEETSEAAGSAKSKRVAEPEERLARTVFVGNVPLSLKRQTLASMFQALLSSLPGYMHPQPTISAPSTAEEGGGHEAQGTEEAQEDKDEAEAGAAGVQGSKDKKEKHDRSPAIESIRFRSVPIAPVRVTPGSDFRVMLRAAAALGAVDAEGKKNSQNAYVVFHRQSDAASALGLNGKEVDGHHLRVDTVRTKDEDGHVDHKRTVFVGNLPYTASEESVRSAFGARISGGAANVAAIRLVRDRITMAGKGIAFVSFVERSHVVEALGMDGASFPGTQRAMRVQRCKPPAADDGPGSGPPPHRGGSMGPSGMRRGGMGARPGGSAAHGGSAGHGNGKPKSHNASFMGQRGDDTVSMPALKKAKHGHAMAGRHRGRGGRPTGRGRGGKP